jgi:hypothetical protein
MASTTTESLLVAQMQAVSELSSLSKSVAALTARIAAMEEQQSRFAAEMRQLLEGLSSQPASGKKRSGLGSVGEPSSSGKKKGSNFTNIQNYFKTNFAAYWEDITRLPFYDECKQAVDTAKKQEGSEQWKRAVTGEVYKHFVATPAPSDELSVALKVRFTTDHAAAKAEHTRQKEESERQAAGVSSATLPPLADPAQSSQADTLAKLAALKAVAGTQQ